MDHGIGTNRNPQIGVVAVTGDSWHGIRTTRHHLLRNLARFFQVGWLEPSQHWRRRVLVRHPLAKEQQGLEAGGVHIAGVEGVAKLQPLRWIPDFYRPERARLAVRAKRYQLAANALRTAGCETVLLHIWRPDYVDALDSRQFFDGVIYHIDDEYSFADTLVPMSVAERRLIEEADAVIVHSAGLVDRKGHINESTFVVPNGVDFEEYSRCYDPPPDLLSIPGPRIGYAGVIRSHLDIAMLRQLAERRPDWSLTFVGPLGYLGGCESDISVISRLPNVHLMGYRSPDELPAYQHHFDVCTMPYRLTAYTDCIYPLKLHEYLAGGKPVVGTPIRTLRDFSDVISLASGVEEWISAIEACLKKEANDSDRVSLRRRVAAEHDWIKLAGQTARIMESLVGPGSDRVDGFSQLRP
ncbi:glycosyltransferase [Lentisalinibacter salinarum]|uniref:glycosyltransferase n=1 Tax=Lentisalinibacter salinarum TaxID=2992239 RepID=UPI0038642811